MSKRAMRRHHYQRLKKKRNKYYGGVSDKREIGLFANTPKICSDICCGNPRRHFGEITIQERKAEKNDLDFC